MDERGSGGRKAREISCAIFETTEGVSRIEPGYAEVYIALANVIRRFDMTLGDVVREKDVDVVRDCIVGFPSKESRGVKVRILKEL